MKLLYSATSPFARKTRVVALEKGLADQISFVSVVALGTEAETQPVRAANPLGKIPALELAGGGALYDSPVICEYLDSLPSSSPGLLAASGAARWSALRLQALGDGVADAGFNIVMEGRRDADKRSDFWVERWTAAILRSADAVEVELASGDLPFDLGGIGLACAFAYILFRLPHIDWRAGRPKLAAWMDAADARPSMAATAPPAA
jgi:glutathione S-transferase